MSRKTLISSKNSSQSPIPPSACALLLGLAILGQVLASGGLAAQIPAGVLPSQPAAQTANPISRAAWRTGEVSAQPIGLSLDDAIQRGLKTNLGVILSGTQTAVGARPAAEPVAIAAALGGRQRQGNRDRRSTCPPRGCAFPAFPRSSGRSDITDLRASLSWSLVNVTSLRNYLAARHNFAAAQLSAQDARELVVLTVGNAYLLVLADETQVASVEAQVATAKDFARPGGRQSPGGHGAAAG